MEINYDSWLILLSLLACSFAMFGTFGFVDSLYRATPANIKFLLPIYTLSAGTGLCGIHFINLLAFNKDKNFFLFTQPTLIAWVFALITSFVIIRIASKKMLSLKMLIFGGVIAGLCCYIMFYLGLNSISTSGNISLDPLSLLMALLVVIGVCILVIVALSWMKDYSGENAIFIKLIFSFITAVAIIGVHVTFNTSVIVHSISFISTTGIFSDKKLLAIIIALGLICLFLLVFVVAIYYEKFGASMFKSGFIQFSFLNQQKNINYNEAGFKDALTQLPNRRAFQQQLETAAKRSARAGNMLAIAYIDLDHFKPINDQYGHHVGDEVLFTVAQRLNTSVRGCDLVARLGGDEFVALIEEIKTDADIIPIVERIVQSIKEPFLASNHHIEISCSVGIAVYPRDGDLDKLMISADAAMFKAKESGKNQFRFFDAEIESASDLMLEMQRDLRVAIEDAQFSLLFQPKVDCKTQSPVGVEALIRWNHPSKGIILPNAFIPAAERFGLINQINDWVVEESVRTIYRAKKAGVDLNISINLASQQFRNPNLVAEISRLLTHYHVPASNLTFEIKELTAIKNEALFKLLLAQFKAANIKVALDDFGSHPFTLTYLQDLNVDEIKIDKVFLAAVTADKASWKLVDILIGLAHTLNLNVVAEGVETEAQRQALADLGCNHMQGYLFSHPISEAKIIKLFKLLSINFHITGQFLTSDYMEESD